MTVKRTSPSSSSRRNSFAVNSTQQLDQPTRRRRAHSIAPGDRLSPATKARRSLAPRKSILKAAAIAADDGDDATQSMDITRDYRDDNLTRKSLARRVSFANHAHVRLFEVPDHNTNSTASPQSSPAAEPDPDSPHPTNDENAYPGAQRSRRRSSARYSIGLSDGGGEQSMDMDSDDTGFSPSAFFRAAPVDDEFNDTGGQSEGDDMDVTEVVPRNLVRKRSLSLVPRQPLANLSVPQSPADVHDDQHDESSYVEEESAQSQSFASEGDASQPMEFTVPLIRPPEPPSKEWLALRSATHSGNTPFIPSSDDDGAEDVREMDLTDAVSRLQAARASLDLGEPGGEGGDDSFTSTEDSFVDEHARNDEDGNQTVNVTQLLRRVSLGPSTDSTVTSLFSSQEQTGEEAVNQAVPEIASSATPVGSQGIYPTIPVSPPSGPTSPAAPRVLYPDIPTDEDPVSSAVAPVESALSDRPPVFSAPQSTSSNIPTFETQSAPPATNLPQSKAPLNFSFTPKPRTPASSPAKAPPSPKKFTAAFAPPVTRHSPQKRPSNVLDTDDSAQPSPAKRPRGAERLSITPGRGTGAVRVLLSPSKLSPLKTAPFHVDLVGSSMRSSIGFRRPSGYFLQRKSLNGITPNAAPSPRISPVKNPRRSSYVGFSVGSRGMEDPTRSRSTSPTKANAPEGSLDHPPLLGDMSTRISPRDETPTEENALTDYNDKYDGVEDTIDDDAPSSHISIEEFFEMTGIRFMDDIAAPRRSIVHPSVLRPSRRASTEAQIPLAEYAVAMAVDVPQLELYSYVGKDLQTWVERIKEIHKEAEAEAQKATPPLFQEFVSTDENGQAELLHQLKLIKAHNHAQAKSEWYDWKMQWVEQLYQKADEGFQNLETDAKVLEGIVQQAQEIVPGLQQEYDELMAVLAKEKAEVAELEECDQDYLNELKVTIGEQSAELDTFHDDVKEARAKLDRLEEKLSEVEMQKKEVASVVEDAERRIHMQKTSTRAEILQLKDELEALQSLHMWRATKILPELFEFTYASSYCIKRAENVKTKQKEVSPVLSAVILRSAQQLASQHEDQSILQIVQRLGDYWSSCSQLQTQLKLVSIRFPLTIAETSVGFSATAAVLFPSLKAKALISFIFDTPLFSSWPVLIQSLRCDVEVAYGSINRDTIHEAVTTRLRQASPVNNHACLLDTCMEAMECAA